MLASKGEPTPWGWREIPVRDAAEALAEVRVIDVREPSEYTGPLGHIAGAELVPLGTVASAAAGWSREQPLLLVCRSGGRSGHAARALRQLGFATLYNLSGGMMAWNDAGLPVEK
jgi:sulfur-carrier protein adenylyltransferase/sulfurtransferase